MGRKPNVLPLPIYNREYLHPTPIAPSLVIRQRVTPIPPCPAKSCSIFGPKIFRMLHLSSSPLSSRDRIPFKTNTLKLPSVSVGIMAPLVRRQHVKVPDCMGWRCLSESAHLGIVIVVVVVVAVLGFLYWRFIVKPNLELKRHQMVDETDGQIIDLRQRRSRRIRRLSYSFGESGQIPNAQTALSILQERSRSHHRVTENVTVHWRHRSRSSDPASSPSSSPEHRQPVICSDCGGHRRIHRQPSRDCGPGCCRRAPDTDSKMGPPDPTMPIIPPADRLSPPYPQPPLCWANVPFSTAVPQATVNPEQVSSFRNIPAHVSGAENAPHSHTASQTSSSVNAQPWEAPECAQTTNDARESKASQNVDNNEQPRPLPFETGHAWTISDSETPLPGPTSPQSTKGPGANLVPPAPHCGRRRHRRASTSTTNPQSPQRSQSARSRAPSLKPVFPLSIPIDGPSDLRPERTPGNSQSTFSASSLRSSLRAHDSEASSAGPSSPNEGDHLSSRGHKKRSVRHGRKQGRERQSQGPTNSQFQHRSPEPKVTSVDFSTARDSDDVFGPDAPEFNALQPQDSGNQACGQAGSHHDTQAGNKSSKLPSNKTDSKTGSKTGSKARSKSTTRSASKSRTETAFHVGSDAGASNYSQKANSGSNATSNSRINA